MNFKVGDLCEFHGMTIRCQEFNGTECTIAEGLAERYGPTSKTVELCYRVHAALDGNYWLVEPRHLRLKHLPGDFTPCEEDFSEWLKTVTREKA